ncbi:MAG: hypothetical protein SGARI_000870, partial [Bacillariaceae sp.]
MDENDDDLEGSFEFGEDTMPDHHDDEEANGRMAYTDMDENRINFDTSEYFETLEDDYMDALQENARKMPSVQFAEKDDLIDVSHHRSRNLNGDIDAAALDIFEENVSRGEPLGEEGFRKRYQRPIYNDDDESIDEDMMQDEESDDEDDSEDKKIMKGIMYSMGGAAVFAGLGFLAKTVMGRIAKSEDMDTGGQEMYNGADQTTTVADAAAESAHAAELATEASQAMTLEASLEASFSASSSSLNTGFAAAGAGAQNAGAATAA